MKPLTCPIQSAGEAKAKAPTRRALAKLQTRAKVLEAARRLFSEQGYEGATIRDIALAAGMSTGAVFASFSDKSDLFREIMFSDMKALGQAMRTAGAGAGDIDDSLQRIFAAGYAFYEDQLPLARAAFGVSWSMGEGGLSRKALPVEALYELITEQLSAAQGRGELARGADLRLLGDMLFESYLANYRKAIFGGWNREALNARSRDQIKVILASARAA